MGKHWDMATCVDCKTQRRVSRREWGRASQPRCRACGGRIEPSDQSMEERVELTDAGREMSKKPTLGGQVLT